MSTPIRSSNDDDRSRESDLNSSPPPVRETNRDIPLPVEHTEPAVDSEEFATGDNNTTHHPVVTEQHFPFPVPDRASVVARQKERFGGSRSGRRSSGGSPRPGWRCC